MAALGIFFAAPAGPLGAEAACSAAGSESLGELWAEPGKNSLAVAAAAAPLDVRKACGFPASGPA